MTLKRSGVCFGGEDAGVIFFPSLFLCYFLVKYSADGAQQKAASQRL